MSMLIRTGTLVRKSSRKASVRRTRSAGSTVSGTHGHARPPEPEGLTSAASSVPGSPVNKYYHAYTDHSLNCSPGKASVATTNSTIVSFDESHLVYKTSLDRAYSNDQGSYTTPQNTALQIDEAKKESENICDFLCTSSQIICSSTFITSAVGLSMIVPIVMIALGVKYLDDCPLEPKIPVFHMVGGCFWLLKIGITIWRSIQHRHQGSVDNIFDAVGGQKGITTKTYRTMDALLSVFLLAWHVLGTVW
ncbi:unnamed protein product, partial [Lymnaea stagnalis]